jgi:RNA recognition motif-containing protein
LTKLVVLGIPWQTTEEKLEAHFSQFGPVEDIQIMRDGKTGKNRGFAFITFINPSDTLKAVESDGHDIDGRQCETKYALPEGRVGSARTTRIFIARIPSSVTDTRFKQYFEQFGAIQDAYMPKHSSKQGHRGIGFVTYASAASVERIMSSVHLLDGKEVAIDRATPKDKSGGSITSIGMLPGRLTMSYPNLRMLNAISGHRTGMPSLPAAGGGEGGLGVSPASGAYMTSSASRPIIRQQKQQDYGFGSKSNISMANSAGNLTDMSSHVGMIRSNSSVLSSPQMLSHLEAAAAAAAAAGGSGGGGGGSSGGNSSTDLLAAAQVAAAQYAAAALQSAPTSPDVSTKPYVASHGNGIPEGSPLQRIGILSTSSATSTEAAQHIQEVLNEALQTKNQQQSQDTTTSSSNNNNNNNNNNSTNKDMDPPPPHQQHQHQHSFLAPLPPSSSTTTTTTTQPPNLASNRIFVGKLNTRTSEKDVRDYFVQFGFVLDVYLPRDKTNKHDHRGFGFVTFETEGSIYRIVSSGPHQIKGSIIAIDSAVPRQDDGSGLLDPFQLQQHPYAPHSHSHSHPGAAGPYIPPPLVSAVAVAGSGMVSPHPHHQQQQQHAGYAMHPHHPNVNAYHYQQQQQQQLLQQQMMMVMMQYGAADTNEGLRASMEALSIRFQAGGGPPLPPNNSTTDDNSVDDGQQ